jgi:hypothetical protein
MELNCPDFERLINQQLDARGAAAPEVDQALAGHAAACPACRSTALRYQTLRQAIAALSLHAPLPPVDFAARFPADWASHTLEVEDGETGPIRKFRPAFRILASAAVVLLAVWVGARSSWRLPPGHRVAAPPLTRPIDSHALSNALAEATSATWDLARATSAPAARVGLEVLDEAGRTETAAALSLPDEVGSTAEVFQEVGQRVNEGVAPLSGTARHAFGFLIGTGGG